MGELRRYRKRATSLVTAVRLDLDTDGFSYRKWGGEQVCKPGDWLVDNGGDVYTVDRETFERTYRAVEPGRYAKVALVWSEVSESAGVIETKEGETRYRAGDRLVFNAAGRRDGYAMSPDKFEELYEPLDPETGRAGPTGEGTRAILAKTRDDHLFGPGPKRILALDGGGIRGILTLQVLRRIEDLIRRRTGDGRAVLSDYFDLVGGTSTGAIIAAALALGYEVERIDQIYRELGNSVFEPRFFRKGVLRAKFPVEPLREALRREFGDIQLGDPDALKTGFALVAKRLDTGSPWVVHNNPRGKYFGPSPGSDATPNGEFLLRRIVRASTAAPTFFDPEKIEVDEGTEGAFIDGGVSPHNNPSLQLLMLATLTGHGLGWRLGEDQLLLVSVGTGFKEPLLPPQKVMGMTPAELGIRALSSLMDDASALNEQLLQWLSNSPTSRSIDGEVGDLSGEVLGGGAPWLSYLRYDAQLDRQWLEGDLGLRFDEQDLDSVHEMDKPENMQTLADIGAAAAEHLVQDRHFERTFDPT